MRRPLIALAAVAMLCAWAQEAAAGRVSDIRNTKHNLSSQAYTAGTDDRTVKSSEDQICVFCHTPHAATQGVKPLWNRTMSSTTYTPYTSKSLDATGLDQPGGSSKLCLSCHDGTIALGQVNVLDGASANIAMTGANANKMPSGSGDATGFTRKLGADLTNDHPISFTYDGTLASRDGELQNPATSGGDPKLIDSRTIGYKPKLPLENGQLQCTTCHDPHIRDTDTTVGNIKFLRLNRFQKVAPTTSFNSDNDQICLACHTKDGWVGSAHADPTVANETYTSNAATIRQFPSNLPVWQAGCLNCHDTHTVQGARRLLREGSTGGPVSGFKSGGSSAIEETCYQCHSATGTVTTGGVSGLVLNGQGGANFTVPDIKTDFSKTRRMPIDKSPEVHDIGDSSESKPGKDFIEKRELLGYGDLSKRHVECTDCHNPHRVRKNKSFVGTGATTAGTHDHSPSTGTHTNIASGVLRGTWGVEPVWSSTMSIPFGTLPTSYTIKRGDPGSSISTAVTEPYVTREYQVCLKCHSDYAYGTSPPTVGTETGSTPYDTNGVKTFTNQAMEFAAPSNDEGEPGGNHRSWHPVMAPTKRYTSTRAVGSNNWLDPWNGSTKVGYQTMYCSDCHGSEISGNTVDPSTSGEDGPAWGPHGSNNNFILKGVWNSNTGTNNSSHLCFKCHSYSLYATRGGGSSGFGGSKDSNLHSYHADKVGRMRCNWCHVAVPHGWKNKALLVNLNDVGPEVGLPAGTVKNPPYTQGPYYLNAMVKVTSWRASGSWSDSNCAGRDWMRNNCGSPP